MSRRTAGPAMPLGIVLPVVLVAVLSTLPAAVVAAQAPPRESVREGARSGGAGSRAASGVPGGAGAAAIRSTIATRASSPIVLDGRFDDAAWASVLPADAFTQSVPDGGAPATQRSAARVLFDDKALYIAMRLEDSAPDSIVATLGRRDFTGYSDWAHVIIDSYYDRRTAFRFGVNPAGVKRDGYISGDQEFTEDLGWDAVWDAAVARDSAGWSVEFRIPLSQLRFAVDAAGSRDWGIQFARDLARRNERSTWSLTTPDRAGFVSRFGTLRGMEPPRALRRLEVVPFSVASVTHAPLQPGNPFFKQDLVLPRVGADVKLGLTSDVTLTATVAPDFGQVEADPSVVNLSGNENFFAERRPFFTEGSDLFLQTVSAQGWVGGHDQLFYSRRIGRPPQGGLPSAAEHRSAPRDAQVLGALKLSGKTAGGWAIGGLSALTEETGVRWSDGITQSRSVVEPMSHYGVLRVTKDIARGEGTLGAMLTTTHRRLEGTALHSLRDGALVAGLTGRRRFAEGRFQVLGSIFGSQVRGTAAAITATQRNLVHNFQRRDAAHLEVDSSATVLRGLNAQVMLTKEAGGAWRGGIASQVKTPGFEANDLGFQLRADAIHVGGWVGYDAVGPTKRLRDRAHWGNLFQQTTTAGERMFAGATLWNDFQFHSLHSLSVEGRVDASALAVQALRGGPALTLPTRHSLWLRYRTDQRRRIALEYSQYALRSTESGGYVINATPLVTLRPSARADVSLGPSLSRNRLPWQYVATRSTTLGPTYILGDLTQTTTALTARLNLAFTPNATLQLYAQPFVASGTYRDLFQVVAPRASRWRDRVRPYRGSEYTAHGDGTLTLGSGAAAVRIDDPAFSVGEFRSNAVFRWEYRPGSTLFVVWSQRRDASDAVGAFDPSRQLGDLFSDGGTNVLTVKWSHWLGR